MHFGARLLDFGEREACAARQLLRLARRRDAEARLLEQRHAEQPFELARRAMDARLRHVLAPRAATLKLPMFDDGAERVELRGAHQPVDIDARRRAPRVASATRSRSWLMRAFDARAGRSRRRAVSDDAGAAAQQQRRAEEALEPGDRLRDGGL